MKLQMFDTPERCEVIAGYIISENATVRSAAAKFGISKSTVHKDVTERLMVINPQLYSDVRRVLELNKAERHLRGGEATRLKYLVLSGQNGSSTVSPSPNE